MTVVLSMIAWTALLTAVVYLKVLLGVCPGWILSQSGNVDPTIIGLIGNVGIVGVLIWHLWYHTTHSYPKMLERFSTEQQANRDTFAAELAQLRATFLQEQADLRTYFLRESQVQRDADAVERKELRTMLMQAMQAMRVAVHDVRDTAQQTMNKVDVALRVGDSGQHKLPPLPGRGGHENG